MTKRIIYLVFISMLTPRVWAETFFVHADHLGTPQALTDANGAVVWRADYEPFGRATVDPSSTVEFNVRFPGQYFDQETGLHYNYYRDYDPTTGRYLQPDPIGLDGGINTYAYVAGNPISLSDPEGLDYWVEDADPSESGLGLHQSICVGKYGTQDRYCISFGRKPGQGDCWFGCDGHTYRDRSPAGDIVYPMYRATPRSVDQQIRRYLQSRLGAQREWDAVFGENCRVFSQAEFWYLVNTYGGSAARPDASSSPNRSSPVRPEPAPW